MIDVQAPSETVNVMIKVPKDTHKRFKILCAEKETTMQDVALESITAFVEKNNK